MSARTLGYRSSKAGTTRCADSCAKSTPAEHNPPLRGIHRKEIAMSAAQQGYKSELADWIFNTSHKVNAEGLVLAPDGKTVYTQNARGALGRKYKTVQELIDAALAINHTH